MTTDYDTGYENGSHAAMEHVKPEIDALKAEVFVLRKTAALTPKMNNDLRAAYDEIKKLKARVKKLVEALSVLYFSAIGLSDFWAYGLRKADSEENSAVARQAAYAKAERLGGEISDACKKAKQAIEGV